MKIVKMKDVVWHWIPYCCAEQIDGGKFKGKNYLFLKWMFCF